MAVRSSTLICTAYLVQWTSAALSFAFFYGLLVAPVLIHQGAVVRVRFSHEGVPFTQRGALPGPEAPHKEDAEIEAQIIVRLSHNLLLLTNDKQAPMLIYPNDAIAKIES
jgi:hypothetical protein